MRLYGALNNRNVPPENPCVGQPGGGDVSVAGSPAEARLRPAAKDVRPQN